MHNKYFSPQPLDSIPSSNTSKMQAFYLTFFLLLSLLGFGCAAPAAAANDDPQPDCPSSDPDCPGPGDYIDPKHPIPDYMRVECSGHQVDEEARIKTMARMMDW